jgi:hypothetical protein
MKELHIGSKMVKTLFRSLSRNGQLVCLFSGACQLRVHQLDLSSAGAHDLRVRL